MQTSLRKMELSAVSQIKFNSAKNRQIYNLAELPDRVSGVGEPPISWD